MALCKLSSQEFIQNAFCPTVAVMVSPQAEQISKKNNLSFVELLQPFSKLNTDSHFRDPAGNTTTIHNLRITLLDMNHSPPQPPLARKYLNSSMNVVAEPRLSTYTSGNYTLTVPSSTPWFESWRDMFLQVQFPSDHEFTKHFLACILVISTSDQNPLEVLMQMHQNVSRLQSGTPNKLPKWFSSNSVLRYYVLIHDVLDGNNDIVSKTLESMKLSYGVSNCFLLRMNSRPPGQQDEHILPDPWSQFLSGKPDISDTSENESPQTPAEVGEISSMPSNMTMSIGPLTHGSSSPTLSRAGLELELGQEADEGKASPVMYHPLSPEADASANLMNQDVDYIETDVSTSNLLNANIWQGAPTTVQSVHGACLTTEDIEQLKLCVHEFCSRALIPHIERQIQTLADIVSNKKSRSFLTATKRWFSTNKPGSSGAINTVIYSPEAPELQQRRLGDLYFMFRNYTLAFQAYHAAKRDYIADQAWLHYAGALEMAALSAFMGGEMSRKSSDYMEEAILTYLNTCKMPQFATRATLLSTECLKNRNLFGEAAHQFIRMTSEDSDLRSALLLEQAAFCFLHSPKPMLRKYAFHVVLAGHRFSKASQRSHALRCYKQACQIYQNRNWTLAEDHINFTIGRQATNLNILEEATTAFSKLLTFSSKQNAQQQAVFLREFLNVQQTLGAQRLPGDLPILPIPFLESNHTMVMLGPQPPTTMFGKISASGITFTSNLDVDLTQKWLKLEEVLVQELQGSTPAVFKPVNTLYTNDTNNSLKPFAVEKELVQVSIKLHNPLQIALTLKNVYLLWQFTSVSGDVVLSNENPPTNEEKYIHYSKIALSIIQPKSDQNLVLTLTPLCAGELKITGVCYIMVNGDAADSVGIAGKQEFDIVGPKLKTKEREGRSTDRRLEISVVPSAPCLQACFHDINSRILANELQEVTVELCNIGSKPLQNMMMATSFPHLFVFPGVSTVKMKQPVAPEADAGFFEKLARKNHIALVKLPDSFNGKLQPGQLYSFNVWLQAPDSPGVEAIDLMFYYEAVEPQSIPRYRLVKHAWNLTVQESITAEVSPRISSALSIKKSLAISIKMLNLNDVYGAQVSDVTLLQAALVSKDWKFSKKSSLPDGAKLRSAENMHLLLKAVRHQKKNHLISYSELILDLSQSATTISHQVYMNFAEKYVKKAVSLFHKSESEIDLIVKGDNMSTVILRWMAVVTDANGIKRNAFGQCFNEVNLNCLGKETMAVETALFNDKSKEQTEINPDVLDPLYLVTFSMEHTPKVTHNFIEKTVLVLPVKLHVHNVSNKTVVCRINSPESKSFQQKLRPHSNFPNVNFHWVGRSSFITALTSNATKTYSLKASISAPGVYNLASQINIKCHIDGDSQESSIQLHRAQSSIVVYKMAMTCAKTL